MAVEIKSGDSTDIASVHPTAKAMHVINFSSDGHEGIHSFPAIVATNNATALNEDVLPSLDAEEYKFISVQLVGTWVATVTFEGSNDNTTFYSIATTDPSANGTGQTTATINRVVKVPVLTKYIRARVSAYTSGTISAVAYGHRDENSSGLISTLGEVTLAAETTKKIGNVGIVTDAETLLKDYYVGAVGAVNVNSRVLRAQASSLKSMVMTNLAATPRYVKIYDLATTPVAGSGTPVIVIALPVAGTIAFPLPSDGLSFANGIGMTMTLGPANNNVTGTSTVDFVLMSIFT
tara:strand:- start:68 stop:943 length:876 start_codon:yes stop_codon:yes gene_type:complete